MTNNELFISMATPAIGLIIFKTFLFAMTFHVDKSVQETAILQETQTQNVKEQEKNLVKEKYQCKKIFVL